MAMVTDLKRRNPHLSKRACGWLRHIHRKATTPDDWSEDGVPHEWWDRTSSAPVLDFPRFDLSESSYALGIMADQTPAWREVYAEVLNGLAERHITYWAAVDWLTQFGHDPRRKSYPQDWIDLYLPKDRVGEYDTPGWVANGVEPWGLQPDPIGADGNLFFKGWLNLIQSLHAYVTGEDKWGSPFKVAGVERARFEWTQHRLVEHLVKQWTANPIGPHCENTKVWPYCLSAAGLGLQLYDAIFNRRTHGVYENWLDFTRDKFYGIDKVTGALKWAVLYYDPLIDHKQTIGPSAGLAISFYMMPQAPEFAEFLYRAAVARFGWSDPAKPVKAPADPRFIALGLTVAKEFGDYVTEARLRAYGEEHFEPRFFGDDDTEFGFWFHLGEKWPRGQMSALAMVSEVGEAGAWQRLFREPNLDKFNAPTVRGIDFPSLGVSQACNVTPGGYLQLQTYVGERDQIGRSTHFQVEALPDVSSVKVLCDGAEYDRFRVLGPNSIRIDTTIGTHSFQIFTGYHGEGPREHDDQHRNDQRTGGQFLAGGAADLRTQPASTAGRNLVLGAAGCPCCPAGTSQPAAE